HIHSLITFFRKIYRHHNAFFLQPAHSSLLMYVLMDTELAQILQLLQGQMARIGYRLMQRLGCRVRGKTFLLPGPDPLRAAVV
ncbi:MAG: hypothetical protein R6U55_12210, partial [Desulfovermiculus sp.]